MSLIMVYLISCGILYLFWMLEKDIKEVYSFKDKYVYVVVSLSVEETPVVEAIFVKELDAVKYIYNDYTSRGSQKPKIFRKKIQ